MRGHLFVDVPLAALAIALVPELGWLAPAGAAGVSAAIHAWAVVDPRASLYMPVTWRLGRDVPGCALTFDDGPHAAITPRLLDLLAESRQHATFFLIGAHVRANPALVRRMRAEGHALGLHSDTHSRMFNCWGPARVRADLEACGNAIADATGEPPPRLFRPPVGLKNPIVGWVSTRLDLATVTWTARGRDTREHDVARVIARLGPGLRPGGILLLHDGHEPGRPAERALCLEATGMLLPLLRSRGLVSRALVVQGTGLRLADPEGTGERARPGSASAIATPGR